MYLAIKLMCTSHSESSLQHISFIVLLWNSFFIVTCHYHMHMQGMCILLLPILHCYNCSLAQKSFLVTTLQSSSHSSDNDYWLIHCDNAIDVEREELVIPLSHRFP